MKLKNTISLYLISLIVLQLIENMIKLFTPLLTNNYYFYILPILFKTIIFILILKYLYESKTKFKYVLITVVTFPILLSVIDVCLGNIFIHFWSPQKVDNIEHGLGSILNRETCPFPTSFNFYNFFITTFDYSVMLIKDFFSTYDFINLLYLFLTPYIFYPFLFFKFSLFKVFEENNINPFFSFIPVINKINILKISQLPAYWVLILFIPFIRIFFFYKINKKLSEIQKVNKANAIWMTILPEIFYGQLIFKQKNIR